MAIYHLEAKVVSRGTGRSAVAASAYLSCTNILNDYDGVRHDYTRKKGLIWREVFLPEYAPPEWKDRGVLWNAVEENEKTKDSRLAREFVPALPVELTPTQWQELLSDFIKESFVADGMCADVAIHDPYPPGHNPHAHILLTVRPLDERGEWQYKTEKEYLCVKDGEERGFTAAEFKAAQADGWEKQYPYKVGRKKVYMPPSEAEKQGLERASKHPKSTKFGRQNPISERWNSEEQLVVWRKAWADVGGRSFLPVGIEKGQSISRLPFWVGIKFYCVLFYLTLIVLTLYLNGIFHHHYSIIVLIADCTALYLPSFECAAKQVIKYAFPSFSYRTTML